MTEYELLYPEEEPVDYAGFWLRVWAFLIDTILSASACFALAVCIFYTGNRMNVPLQTTTGVCIGVLGVLYWIYYALMESSKRQATPGKLALKIYVTDEHSKRISFWRASLRHWGKLLSLAFFGTGFLGAGFTDHKQALHDILADCLVICKKTKSDADQD